MGFLRAFLLVFASGAALLAAVNAWLDSDQRWRGRFALEKQIAAILAQGGHAETNSEYRHHAIQRMIIDGMDKAPDTVLIGSSRVMAIRGGFVEAGSVFNHGMPSANLLDLMAVIAAYEARDLLPRRLILGIDPWVARRQALLGARLAPFGDVGPDFGRRLGLDLARMGWQAPPPWDLFSGRAALAAIKDRLRAPGPCDGLRRVEDDRTPCAVRRPDGSLKWTDAFEHIDSATLAAANRLALSRRGRLHGFDGFDAIDEASLDALSRLLAHLRRRGAEVILFLHPYHHDVPAAPRMERDWRLVQEIETRIRALAEAARVPVAGSYDPARTPCRPDEFMDLDHAKPSCLEKIVAPLKRAADVARD